MAIKVGAEGIGKKISGIIITLINIWKKIENTNNNNLIINKWYFYFKIIFLKFNKIYLKLINLLNIWINY